MSATATGVPAGWHPDPTGPAGQQRWWDGVQWTIWVAVDGEVSRAPVLPPAPAGPEEPEDRRAPLPGAALWLTLAAVAWSVALAIGLGYLGWVLDLRTEAEQLVLTSVGLYAGFVLGCVAVRRRWGTDRGFAVDFGVHVRAGDWWRGLVGSLAARGGGAVLAAIVAVLLPRLAGGEVDVGTGDDPTLTLLLAFGIVAVVIAPVVEELFFRGLLLRVLEGVMPAWAALVVQGTLFGLAHIRPGLGTTNVFTVLAIGFAGMLLGWLAQRYRRLGPGIACHAWFNLFAFLVTLVLVSVD